MKYSLLLLSILAVNLSLLAQQDCNEITNSLLVEASNSGPFCPLESIVLTGSGSSILDRDVSFSYLWKGPDGYTSNVQNPTDAKEEGIYQLSIAVGDCSSAEVQTEVIFWKAEEVLNLEIENTGPYCSGESIVLTGSGSTVFSGSGNTVLTGSGSTVLTGSGSSVFNRAITYEWMGPNGFKSTVLNPTNVEEAGIYQLTATLDNCLDLTKMTEVVIAEPAINRIEEVLCSGETIEVNGQVYSEDLPSGTEILSTASSTSCDSIIEIALTFRPSNIIFFDTILCTGEILEREGQFFDEQNPIGFLFVERDQSCDSLYIQVHFQSELSGSISGPDLMTAGDSIALQFNLSGADLFQVTFAQVGETPIVIDNVLDGDVIKVSPLTTTNYKITELKDMEGVNCSVLLGAGHRVLVRNKKESSLYFPNVFSPNNDGINDVFYPLGGKDVQQIEQFQIFDRWGALIFEQHSFSPNDPSFGWDGSYDNEKLDTNVFIYFSKILFLSGEEEIITGDVALLRNR